MIAHLRPAFVLLILLSILTGLIYPLVMTGIAQLAFPAQANGSLIVKDGQVIGSALIGQNFTGAKYFHGRPSATTDTDPNDAAKTVPAPYNASSSSASNLGPTSKALIDRIATDVATLKAQGSGPIPIDLVTTSASGLDPHISPQAALYQVPRVAKARAMDEAAIRAIVNRHIEDRLFGVLGEPVVNVLKLNLDLDAAAAK